MIIDGKQIAKQILSDTKKILSQTKGITPHLSIFIVGNDPNSLLYISQKQRVLSLIGGTSKVFAYPPSVPYSVISKDLLIEANNPKTHGIIIQRPIGGTLSTEALMKCIPVSKDVDSFRVKSPYIAPIGQAILTILLAIYLGNGTEIIPIEKSKVQTLSQLIRKKTILLIGRGETAGKPIAKTLQDHKIPCLIATSNTNLDDYIPEADIIISAVGKPNIVRPDLLKNGVVLLSVGMWKDKKGKLHGDFEQEGIQHQALWHTPTPGGVGPVNVAFLIQNLIHASTNKHS